MKTRKKLSLVLMILISLLIILAGFVGIYKKNANKYSDIIPDYKFASDLKGFRVIELEVSNSKNTTYYDKEGKKVEDSEITEENENDYTKEEVAVNKEEVLNTENYKKTLEIFKKRLKFLKVDQYRLDLDEETGKIILTFEDDYPEDVESILPMEGKLSLVDSNTSDVILDYSDIKSVEVNYAQTEDGYTIYMDFKLTNDGINKMKDIDKYKNAEIKNDDSEEVTSTDNTNKFKIEFDKEEIEEVSYDDMNLNKKTLRITTAKNLTNTQSVNSKLNIENVVAKLASIGKTPVVYNLSGEEYQNIEVNSNILLGTIIALAVIIAIISLYLIIRFKFNGVLTTITMIANMALFTILIRLTNIAISLNSIAGLAALLVINTCLVVNMLKEILNEEKTFGSNIRTAYLKSIDILIISLIVFAVFAFNSAATISTMGLLLFWGWLVVVIGNLLLTVPMLKIGGKE